jgi:hypothetical protein
MFIQCLRDGRRRQAAGYHRGARARDIKAPIRSPWRSRQCRPASTASSAPNGYVLHMGCPQETEIIERTFLSRIRTGLFDRIPVRMPNGASFAAVIAVINVLKIPNRVFSSLRAISRSIHPTQMPEDPYSGRRRRDRQIA